MSVFCVSFCVYVRTSWFGGWPRGVMFKATDCGIVLSEFVLQSRYYVHSPTNTLGKSMNPFILPAIGLNNTTTVLLGENLRR